LTISRAAEHLALAWAANTGAGLAKTNVKGGAEQQGGRYGLPTMLEGGGMAKRHHHRAVGLRRQQNPRASSCHGAEGLSSVGVSRASRSALAATSVTAFPSTLPISTLCCREH
jgi:hypothetical protein